MKLKHTPHTQIDRELGGYALIRHIEENLFGELYAAEHMRTRKQYDLLILHPDLFPDSHALLRFDREISFLELLEHPRLIKFLGKASVDDTHLLVFPSSEGRTLLSDYLLVHQELLKEEQVFAIAEQVAAALDEGHEKIFAGMPLCCGALRLNHLCIHQEKGKIEMELAYFGLGHLLGAVGIIGRTFSLAHQSLYANEESSSGPSRFSKAARIFHNSYTFLAPEHRLLTDATRSSDLKADVFAFGTLVYHLLTRRFAEGLFELPSQIRSDLKWDWDHLILSCLKQDPSKRPAYLLPLFEKMCSGKAQVLDSSIGKPVIKPNPIDRPVEDLDPSLKFQVDSAVVKYTPKRQETKEQEPLLTEMAIIEAGTYSRGSDSGARDEMPKHMVHLKPFAIDIHPVTNEQFVRFLEMLGGEKDVNHNDVIGLRESRIKKMGGKLLIESGYAKHPVVGVTWFGAVAYAKWIGKRLPTEVEWEIACLGGLEGAQYPTGDAIERSQANFFNSDTTVTMSYPPNGYGLFDMAGNVYEWCEDWYAYNYYDASMHEPNDPRGPLQGIYRILRGGCWKSLTEYLRCSHRHRNKPSAVNSTYGFRCAADVSFQ